jgi:SAM-dependent methyltransferase
VLVLALGQGAALPAWVWLVLLGLLVLAYPVHAWRDAPVFPTPRGALVDLPRHAPLPASEARRVPQVLDAGCGMGDGLIELHAAYPLAQVHGIEWSWLWRVVAALRCPWARVRRGDMWAQSWADFDLVYVFQRPETMPRAMDKARREMRPGSWLVSLEFEGRDAEGVACRPHARLSLAGGRPIWVYRLG